MSRLQPHVRFAQPHMLDAKLGRELASEYDSIVVLDLAFNNREFKKTYAFWLEVKDKLVLWADHHPHDWWKAFKGDTRFVLEGRDKAPSCASLVAGLIDLAPKGKTVVLTHGDFDGVMSAAIWIAGKPYPGAVDDANCFDTKTGTPTPRGLELEHALKADMSDNSIKYAVLRDLLDEEDYNSAAILDCARATYGEVMKATQLYVAAAWADGNIAMVDTTRSDHGGFDLTELLLGLSAWRPVQMVSWLNGSDEKLLTISCDKGYANLVKALGLGGGMANRVTIPQARFAEAVELLR